MDFKGDNYDDKQICFIICANNLSYVEEALYYIQRLEVPEGYTLDCLTIWDAKSMTSGYNEGMRASGAKYKVYIHQDVFITDTGFIHTLLKLFEDESIGMIGSVGSPKLPENGIMWYGERVGRLYGSTVNETFLNRYSDVKGEYEIVDCVDGCMIATQYDIPWREDVFTGWDFYDLSQSFEFRKRGYKVVVPRLERPWHMHDDGAFNLKNYYHTRKIFLREYADMLNRE